MKVFMCRRQYQKEAFKTFCEDKDCNWMAYTYDVDFWGFPEWHSDYYPIEKWFECKELTANVNEPCVIMEDGYSD